MLILEMAAEWGSPAWQLTGDPADAESTYLWTLRWQAWREELARAQRDADRHGDKPGRGGPRIGRPPR